MSQPQYDLRAEYEAAEAARVAAEQAHAALGAAETEAQREREHRHRKAWQDFADSYDPAALSQSVENAEKQLRDAFSESTLGRALVAYQTAIHREGVHHKLARDATKAGASLRPGVTPGARVLRDGAGKQIADPMNSFIAPVISQVVFEHATKQVQTEQDAIHATAASAYDSVDIPAPDTFKVIAPFIEDRTEVVGSVHTHFVADPAGSVAYLDPTNPALRWYQQHTDFDVQAVYGVPTQYRTAAQRMARQGADLYKPGASSMAGAEADPGAATNPALRRG